MRPQVVAVTGAGTSAPIALDWEQKTFNVGIQAVIDGTVSDYDIQGTLDDVNAVGIAGATWQSLAGFDNLSANIISGVPTPTRWVRINLVTGTGTVTLTTVQSS